MLVTVKMPSLLLGEFHFGDLPIEMAVRGHAVVVALINHTGRSTPYREKKLAGVPGIARMQLMTFERSVE